MDLSSYNISIVQEFLKIEKDVMMDLKKLSTKEMHDAKVRDHILLSYSQKKGESSIGVIYLENIKTTC